jgi:hypothetical protein
VDLSRHVGEGGTFHEHVGRIQEFDLVLGVEELRPVVHIRIGVRSREEDISVHTDENRVERKESITYPEGVSVTDE